MPTSGDDSAVSQGPTWCCEAAEGRVRRKSLQRSAKTCLFLKLQQRLRPSRRTRLRPLRCRPRTVGTVLRQFRATKSALAAVCDAENKLSCKLCKRTPPRCPTSKLLMTPLIAGETLGLLGSQGIRCWKRCLLFDSIACTGFFLCSTLLTCVDCQTDVFCFTAFGLCLS